MANSDSVLKAVIEKIRSRAVACEDAADGEDAVAYAADARQAIREEAMWLNALLIEIDDMMEVSKANG